MSEEAEIDSEKIFEIELNTNKKNSFKVLFKLENIIEVTAVQKNDIVRKSYSGKYSFEEIRDNKYFLQFNSLDVIFEELKDRIYNNQIIIEENGNNIHINIPLPKNKEFVFELIPFIKDNNERLNELTELIMKLKAEMDDIKNENIIYDMKGKETQLIKINYELINDINDLKNELKQLKNENKRLEKDIKDMKDKEAKLMNENTQIKKDINLLTNEANQIIKENKQLQKDIEDFKKNEEQFISEKTQIINNINILKNNVEKLTNENNQLKKVIDDKNKNEDQIINEKKKIKDENNFLEKNIKQLTNESKKLINNEKQLNNEKYKLRKKESQFKFENNQFKNEFSELKEKLDILWKEKIMINNLDSKIIKGNEKYNEALKNWINPSRKIKAELLYRLSENGDKYSTFHELCDNKGPTLTLFHIN